ncbi:tRNA pseudouridine(38/39) synthase [Babesia sp. Xinjiang]|uniref:tRNA pseudouridine(38/39) synthase n=1 Tax=Babesia sp. Xinjiang TaxID=462227 RepID=UPI000A242766|nr:tRNA pseudouridine(38/39) synthase [Babesia sp. Xinjiang]ORM42177.1 tRNA pseudouridine(38/39) synthase [Babesia sp. Xinjiang]
MCDSSGSKGPCGGKVLVDFSYLGTGFHGLAYQVDEPNTVEGHLFRALSVANIARDVQSNGYERCGRTDRDVHALHNYCSFFTDPCSPDGPCSSVPSSYCDRGTCYRMNSFVKCVNKHLPSSIRINSVTRVSDDFSARRDCLMRTYKYFFQLGCMDLGLMKEGCKYFLGTHDFKQFCKVDNRNPIDTHATIMSFEVDRYNDLLCVATVTGRAFLWHQVRCMIGMLFEVGKGCVAPVKILCLLENPNLSKFNYKMASAHGLILYECVHNIPYEGIPARNRAVYQQTLDDTIQTLGPLSLLAGRF